MPGFTCSSCGAHHDELPLAYSADAPAYWSPELAGTPGSELSSDQCVINGEHFFIRGIVAIPILDANETFEWGAWVSVSHSNAIDIIEKWEQVGREHSNQYFGWLSTELPSYPSTLNLKTNLHTRAVGQRPMIELEPTEHPLAVEQRTGITMARVQELAEQLLH